MDEKAAHVMATKWLKDHDLSDRFEVRSVKAYDNLYLAFWDSKDGELVAGNSPLLIDPAKGTIISTGTAHPMEFYLTNYRITGDPGITPIKRVKIASAFTTANKASAITILKNSAALELIEAKHALDSVLGGRTISILPSNETEAEDLATQLRNCDFSTSIELCSPENQAPCTTK